jgi:hypothetical protein
VGGREIKRSATVRRSRHRQHVGPLLPAPSRAVTVMTLVPGARAMDEIVQRRRARRRAAHRRGRCVQVTCVTATSSVAVPAQGDGRDCPSNRSPRRWASQITIEGSLPVGHREVEGTAPRPGSSRVRCADRPGRRPAARTTPGDTRHTAPFVAQPACAGVRSI